MFTRVNYDKILIEYAGLDTFTGVTVQVLLACN
jgi:hypothetical protein